MTRSLTVALAAVLFWGASAPAPVSQQTVASLIAAQEVEDPIQPMASIVSGHEQLDDDGSVIPERTPFDTFDRIKLDASGSTGGVKYIWGVFVEYDVHPDDMRGRAAPAAIEAVRTVKEHGGKAALPVHDNSGLIEEYNGGDILDILPIPGTYYVSLTAIANNEGHQVQAIIRVNPYPGQSPRPPPDPPDDKYDLSGETVDWLTTVPATNRRFMDSLATFISGVATQPDRSTHKIIRASLEFGWPIALGHDPAGDPPLSNPDDVAAWESFRLELLAALDAIEAGSTLAQYRGAVGSVGKELLEQ